MYFKLKVLVFYGLLMGFGWAKKLPNIVFFLTDDQDVELGGMNPLTKAKKLIGDQGIHFKNMFVSSPLCCPSRSSILTGNYVHNHGAMNNSLSGNCSSPAWQKDSEQSAFITQIKKQGYNTFFAGKYLNQYGFPHSGGVEHIPPGWDDWHGLVGNSVYYDYTLSNNGKAEKHGNKYEEDYLTDVISKRSLSFLDRQAAHLIRKPIFMMLSTPAAHAPFTPAPQYANNFSHVNAPRDGSFNKAGKDKHWLLRAAKNPMSNESLAYIDPAFRNRWRTLLSVDDMIEKVVQKLKDMDELDNTYLVYSSDNGFHLGQFSLPNDKRQLYEFDIRVPLMVRGPGIPPNQTRNEVIVNIDFAPTFIELAGSTPPKNIDGQSFAKLFDKPMGDAFRTDFVVEHAGEFDENIKDCPQYANQMLANCFPDCVCEDAYNNTYSCVRTLAKGLNMMFCQFSDAEEFIEVYDLSKDPHQLSNVAKSIDPQMLLAMSERLIKLSICKGPSCNLPVDHRYYKPHFDIL